MNNIAQEDAKGLTPISTIIESQYKDEAFQVAGYLRSISLQGNVTKESRTAEDIEKDTKAIQFLKDLSDVDNPALVYGFMLYNETGIVKQYWAKRCGILRKNKRVFWDQDVYIEWLINIYSILNGDHESIHDPLYFYKPGGTNSSGKVVGDYDVMNSFRTYWNMYCLTMLAKWLYKQDKKEMKSYSDISIEQSMENADAGHHLEAEMAEHNGFASPDDDITSTEVEQVLKSFLKPEWQAPLRAGAKSGDTSALDLVKAIASKEVESLADLRKKFNLSQSVANSSLDKILRQFSNRGLSLKDFSDYLSKYPVVACDILDGKDVTWSQS